MTGAAVPHYRELEYDCVGIEQLLLFCRHIDSAVGIKFGYVAYLRIGIDARELFYDSLVGYRVFPIWMTNYD